MSIYLTKGPRLSSRKNEEMAIDCNGCSKLSSSIVHNGAWLKSDGAELDLSQYRSVEGATVAFERSDFSEHYCLYILHRQSVPKE